MATNILEAFVSLWADDSRLRASFQGLAPAAHLAGTTVGDRFAAGVAKAAAAAHENFRKEFIGPLQTEAAGTGIGRGMAPRPQDQYRSADLAFHKNMGVVVRASTQALGEHAQTQQGLARAQAVVGRAGREAREGIDEYNLSVRDAAGTVKLLGVSVLSQLNPVLGESGSVALAAARNLKDLGVGMAAGGAAAAGLALALGLYIAKIREGIAAQVALAQAMRRGDFAAVDQQASQAGDAISRFEKQAALAAQPVKDLGSASEVIVAYWANTFGPSLDTLSTRMKAAAEGAKKLFLEFQVPKLALHAAIDQEQLTQRSLDMDRQSAESTNALRVVVDRLTESRRKQAEAQAALIEDEARVITRRQQLGELDPKTADELRADVARRALNARKQGELEVRQIRRDGLRDVVALEERQMAHAEQMGRVSMAAANDFQRAATTDPRRTLQEQQSAETKLFQGRRAEAQALLTFQSQLTGTSGFTEQLEVQLRFLREISKAGGEGSGAWFDQVTKVFDVYKGIREQAQGILSGMVSIVAAEVSRAAAEQQRADARKTSDADEASHVEKMARSREADALTRRKADQVDSEIEARPTRKKMTTRERSDEIEGARTRIRERREAAQAKEEEATREEAARQRQRTEAEAATKQREEAGKVSLRDFPSILRDARQRDANALRGDRVPIGDIGGAVGRVDFWKTVDKEKLSPDVALSRLMEDPSAKLARALEGLMGGAADVTPALSELGAAAAMAAEALRAVAGAGPENGGSQASPARRPRRGPPLSEENVGSQSDLADRPRGGPQMSEENRQAILDTVSTQLTDENLAVYGRR